jgi:xanthine dehydrogenase/oxidase
VLQLPVCAVQEANFYKVGQLTPALQPLQYCSLDRVWRGLKRISRYDSQLEEVAAFNKEHRWRKRGVAMTPTKFGIGYQSWQSAATVKLFPADGTVMVAHGGCEIGQGIHTKVAQATAYALGCELSQVRVMPTSTDKIPNNTMTGGSGTSEASVKAVMMACKVLADRLAPLRSTGKTWAEVVADAAAARYNLQADGWWAPAPTPPASAPLSEFFTYFVWCAACSVVEVDVLSGEVTVLSSTINYDCGVSMNPAVDCGQIEGAFVMGLGNVQMYIHSIHHAQYTPCTVYTMHSIHHAQYTYTVYIHSIHHAQYTPYTTHGDASRVLPHRGGCLLPGHGGAALEWHLGLQAALLARHSPRVYR